MSMAKFSRRQITARDREILCSLYRDPKTPDQLLRESVVFNEPFHTQLRLQVRLKQLTDAGILKRWRYFDGTDGAAPYYYKLSREGFRLVAGPDALPPTKRYFAEISPSLHRHHRAVADCNIQMLVSARQSRIRIAEFHPQDSLVLSIGNERVIPDSTWQLVPQNERHHRFYFEIDCSTESLVSQHQSNTLEQKIRRYEALHYKSPQPFRVVFVFTQSTDRRDHFLKLAAKVVKNSHRVIFYGAVLHDFVTAVDVLHAPVCHDQNSANTSLITEVPPETRLLDQTLTPVYSRNPRRQTVAAGPREGTVLTLPFPDRPQ